MMLFSHRDVHLGQNSLHSNQSACDKKLDLRIYTYIYRWKQLQQSERDIVQKRTKVVTESMASSELCFSGKILLNQ